MAAEHNERSNGWPLGLEIMNIRLGLMESLQDAPPGPYSLHMLSPNFSSFSSSNLDTESTASFFQEHRLSLGRLMGMRAGDMRGSCLSSRIHLDNEQQRMTTKGVRVSSKGRGVNMSQGICIPLLRVTVQKITKSKAKSSP